MKTITHRYRSRALALIAFAAVGVLMAAAPAVADTSQATASAANLALLNVPAVSTGSVSASNDGSTETTTGATTPPLSILGTQSIILAGVLVQQARAFSDGTSAACAGVVGTGGIIQIGVGGTCTVTGGAANGVSIIGAVTADAILEKCVASSDGTATATTEIVNAKIAGIPINLTLPTINIPLIANLEPGAATTVGSGGAVSATALHLDALALLGPPLASLDLGHVTCGANAQTSPTPAFPVGGLPIAGGIIALAGGAVYYRRRHATKAVA